MTKGKTWKKRELGGTDDMVDNVIRIIQLMVETEC